MQIEILTWLVHKHHDIGPCFEGLLFCHVIDLKFDAIHIRLD